MGREATKLAVHKQRGATVLLFIVGMFLTMATIFAVKLLVPAQRGAKHSEVTDANLLAIQQAVVAYVALNGHLPCPANPAAANDGVSDPVPPNSTCNSPAGVVPWTTLGLAPDLVLDGWNRRISYRVFQGATGLTQAGGASMANCDTNLPVAPAPLAPGDLCTLAHTNLDTQFLAGKGLQVNDSGNLISGIAYLLISHGESGYGAYLPGGGRVQLPTAGDELTNTGAASPYFRKPHSDAGIDPTAAAHFDDVLAWVTISELAARSGVEARDWP